MTDSKSVLILYEVFFVIIKKCLQCSKATKNNRFCSHSCAATYNNKRRIISAEQKLKTSETLKTGFLLETTEQRKERLRKNLESWQNPERKKRHSEMMKKRWDEYIKNTSFNSLHKKTKKRVLLKESDNTCDKCGYHYYDPVIKGGPFEIHHKDGDNSNWDRSNLEVLCLICHWKTDNYRFRNKTHSEEARIKISECSKEFWCVTKAFPL